MPWADCLLSSSSAVSVWYVGIDRATSVKWIDRQTDKKDPPNQEMHIRTLVIAVVLAAVTPRAAAGAGDALGRLLSALLGRDGCMFTYD